MDRRLPNSDKYMNLDGIFLEGYLAEFDLPARMRLTISNYAVAGVAGARHYYGKLEYIGDQCLVSVEMTRPTLLIEREANPDLSTRTNSFTTKDQLLDVVQAFAEEHQIEVWIKRWATTIDERGDKIADAVEVSFAEYRLEGQPGPTE